MTVELPPMVWRGEMEPRGKTKAGVEILISRPYTLSLPPNDAVFRAPALTIDVVRQAMDVYHRQNPGRTRFQVTESAMGFHIVPSAAYDESGRMGPAVRVLDAPVSVPMAMRTATEHLHALLAAASKQAGIPVQYVGWSLDGRYAANGWIVSNFPAEAERKYSEFRWGASEMLAREALEDLLSGSATTMTWSLSCGPDAAAQNRQACWVGLNPLAVGGQRTNVFLDRCTNCKWVPK